MPQARTVVLQDLSLVVAPSLQGRAQSGCALAQRDRHRACYERQQRQAGGTGTMSSATWATKLFPMLI